MEIAIGTRVRVMNIDQTEELGFGTYIGEVVIADIEDRDEEGSDRVDPEGPIRDPGDEALLELFKELGDLDVNTTTPQIRLDSGRIIYGFECWWTPENDVVSN